MKPITRIAAVLFGVVALAHLWRIVRPFSIVVAEEPIPQWASVVGLVVAGALALLLWREARR